MRCVVFKNDEEALGWLLDQMTLWAPKEVPHELVNVGGRIVALLSDAADTPPELDVSLMCDVQVISRPDSGHTADLSGPLLKLPLTPVEPAPAGRAVLFHAQGTPDQAREFLRHLLEFPHGRLGVVQGKLSMGSSPSWLVGVEQLGSVTPLDPEWRHRFGEVRAYYVVADEGPLASGRGLFVEQGFEGHAALARLWPRYGGTRRDGVVLRCGNGDVLDAGKVRFSPPSEVACLVSAQVALQPFSPATGPADFGTIEVRIEERAYPGAESCQARRRALIDLIEYLEAELERVEDASDDAPSPLTLLWVPQSAERGLRQTLRRTPEEVLAHFAYYCGRWGGERSHFIYPRPEAPLRSLPPVGGAVTLYALRRWHDAGLRLFLPLDRRLMPDLHLSHAAAIRRALAPTAPADSLLAFGQTAAGQEQLFQLPNPATSFLRLTDALSYANGGVLAAEPAAVQATVDAFCADMRGTVHRQVQDNGLDRQFEALIDMPRRFFDQATDELNRKEDVLRKVRADIDALQSLLKHKQAGVRAVNQQINEALCIQGEEKLLGDMRALLGRIESLKNGA